jgi:DNA-binding protein H-NS
MSKLAAIKKQIAALEAQAERLAKQEMSGAIAKVKEIMTTFGLTVEHLQSTATTKKRGASKATRGKRPGGGAAKYADPTTGKTWSGFGRAPAWIADAKNRDAFLIDKGGAMAPAAKKRSSTKNGSVKRVAKAAAKSVVAVAKKAKSKAAPVTAKKKPIVKSAATKKSAKKRATSVGSAGAATATGGVEPSAT